MSQGDYFNGKSGEKEVVETIQPVESPLTDPDQSENQLEEPEWKPGFFRQFPVLGFAALCVALMCAIAELIVLQVSNNESDRHWPKKLAPNVILSGLNSVANICFSMAIGTCARRD